MKMMKTFYGPVSSWRLGKSLGVDPICSEEKICPFDCVYCQLGSNKPIYTRRKFIGLGKLKKEVNQVRDLEPDLDVVTLSGTGEPTLAKNLEEIIDFLKNQFNLPIAILTSSSLFSDKDVISTLSKIDNVVAKLDASNKRTFKKINRPHGEIDYCDYLEGLRDFREKYSGIFSLQVMFIGENKDEANELASIAKELDPDEIQLNTPLRPRKANPLNKKEFREIKRIFDDLGNVKCVYDAKKPKVQPMDAEEVQKRKRSKK